jgi:multisubunit Na+/H+ antiporter MnhB subunit
MVFWLRVIAIAVGVVLFALAEFRDVANEKKPYTTGRERYGTFYDDATVLGLRLAGVGLVVLSLISWVIGNHASPDRV